MSLNYDLRECTFDRDNDNECTIANRLIWETIAVDLGSIEDSNLDEWVFRMAVLQTLRNRISDDFGPITKDFLRPYIGLFTNVATTSRAKFMNRAKAMLKTEAETYIRYHCTENHDAEVAAT